MLGYRKYHVRIPLRQMGDSSLAKIKHIRDNESNNTKKYSENFSKKQLYGEFTTDVSTKQPGAIILEKIEQIPMIIL